MDPNFRARLRWACRRGMLELDVILMPFFDHEFDTLTTPEQECFATLLTHDDPDLFLWFMKHQQPKDPALVAMVEMILERNHARHSCA